MKIENPIWKKNDKIRKIFKALDYHVRFVGGCVRDSLLDKKPQDIDLATPLRPLKIKKHLNKAGFRVLPTGIKHGTLTILTGDKKFPSIEITTLRQDIETDGRHARVIFTTKWNRDALRRDFTMNALYADLQGNVFDYYEGIQDVLEGKLCFIGEAQKRIEEDYLRILRYFRFFAFYSKKEADKEILELIATQKEKLLKVSIERVKKELFLILASPKAPETLRLMEQTGILQIYFPKPELESFNSLVSSLKNSSHFYRFFSLINLEEEHLLEAQSRWFLGRKELKKIRYIRAYDTSKNPENYTFNDIFRFLVYFNQYDKDEIISFLQAKNLDKEWLSLKDRVKDVIIPVFEFSGKDLLPFVEQRKIKEHLDIVYEYWLSKNGQASREELLEYIHHFFNHEKTLD